jgi:asparagine synthase (glutamine-hydrolysing)
MPPLAEPLMQRFSSFSHRYSIVHRDSGIVIASTALGANIRPLDLARGAVIGSLYEKHRDAFDEEPSRSARLDETTQHAIVASGGKLLIEKYWGNYVALIRDGAFLRFIVPPSGSLPCFVQLLEGVVVAFSDPLDAQRVLGRRYRRTHEYTRSRVLGEMVSTKGPLDGVHRMLRGESLTISRAAADRLERSMIWHPAAFQAENERIDDVHIARRAVRSSVHSATRTLAREHKSILLRLSGGLDSTIIAACLKNVDSDVHSHTYVQTATNADTRPWSREVAQFCGFPLHESVIDPAELRIDALFGLAPSPDATPLLEYLFRHDLELALCMKHGASAIFTGDGGDSGFCRDSIALSCLDYLTHYGLSLGALEIARNVAMATQQTMWTVLMRAARYYFRGQRLKDQSKSGEAAQRLVHRDLRLSHHDEDLHPWLYFDGNIRWDTFYRVGALIVPPQPYSLSINTGTRNLEIAQPLYAQPVLELLLRIPIYTHFHQGRTRGLARLAFAGDAPKANLERTWKDRAPGFLHTLIHRHRARLREIFLDGILVRDRLLDRDAVELALSTNPGSSQFLPTEIVRHLETEIWARAWDSLPSHPH